jgi:hypothetical protein
MLTNPPAELQELTFKLVPGDGDVVAVHYMDWKPTLEVELPEWMNDGYM